MKAKTKIKIYMDISKGVDKSVGSAKVRVW